MGKKQQANTFVPLGRYKSHVQKLKEINERMEAEVDNISSQFGATMMMALTMPPYRWNEDKVIRFMKIIFSLWGTMLSEGIDPVQKCIEEYGTDFSGVKQKAREL